MKSHCKNLFYWPHYIVFIALCGLSACNYNESNKDKKNDKINIYFMDKIAQLSSEIPLLQEPEEKLTMSMAREVMEDESSNQVDSRFKNIVTTPSVKYDP